jgi:hypothetical protein
MVNAPGAKGLHGNPAESVGSRAPHSVLIEAEPRPLPGNADVHAICLSLSLDGLPAKLRLEGLTGQACLRDHPTDRSDGPCARIGRLALHSNHPREKS